MRQLSHAVEAAIVRAWGEGMALIQPDHVFPESATPEPISLDFHAATLEFQRRLLAEALSESGWNVSEAAARLGLARSHLYTLMGATGLKRPAR